MEIEKLDERSEILSNNNSSGSNTSFGIDRLNIYFKCKPDVTVLSPWGVKQGRKTQPLMVESIQIDYDKQEFMPLANTHLVIRERLQVWEDMPQQLLERMISQTISHVEKRVKSVSPQNNVLDVGVNVIFKYDINSNTKEELSQHLEPSRTAYYPDLPTRSSNKDEAVRAKELAFKKLSSNDFKGAKKVGLKAQKLYPEVEEITQLLKICDVHCCAEKRILGSEKDLYGILQVERRADGSTIRKQYKRLALHLQPDKNRLPGAEAAFKLISEANEILSDSAKKSLYDTKIRIF